MQTVKCVCARDCPDSCFIDATVENGKLISTKGSTDSPYTAGFLCARGKADPKRVYSEKRVLYPHIRDDSGELQQITWDEALDIMATRLKSTLSTKGPEGALLLDYAGNVGLLSSQFSQRLWNVLGVTRTDYAVCSKSGHLAIMLHYGLSYGIEPDTLDNYPLIIFWGSNAAVSGSHIWNQAHQARKKHNAKIVVIDPRQSKTAELADLWISPRQGSDVSLVYGLTKYLFEHNGVDRAFCEKFTTGFQSFEEETLSWDKEKITSNTGLDWDVIGQLGQLLIENKTAAFIIGIGLNKSIYGAESVRAVSLLPALLGQHRGFFYTNSKGHAIDYNLLSGKSLTKKKNKTIHQIKVGSHLENGDFSFVYVFGMNPAITLPNAKAVEKGLKRDDTFVVVHDTHFTKTTECANLILPAATFYEKDDIIISESHPFVRFSHKAIKPCGESKEEIWVMQQLAKKLDIQDHWVYSDPFPVLEASLRFSFEKGSFDSLKNGEMCRLRQFSPSEYLTSSGKIEFASFAAKEMEQSPLPLQLPLPEKNKLILLSSAHPNYTHSQFQDIFGEIEKVVWIHPKNAEEKNIFQGDTVILKNNNGMLEITAYITKKIAPNMLWMPRLVSDQYGNTLNCLIPDTIQEIGNGAVFNSTEVIVEKK